MQQFDENLLAKEAFSQYDTQLTGCIDSGNLVYVLRALGYSVTAEEAREIAKQIEKVEIVNGMQSNNIYYPQFVQYVSENPPQLFHDEELKELFENLLMKTRDDVTHKLSTFLTVDDFLFELRTLGVKLS